MLVRIVSALLLVSAIACGDAVPPAPPADPSTTRTLAQGTLVGFADENAHVWRGIPFAAPPVGALRWRAPRPPEPWTDTLQALEFGAACMQFGGPMSGPGSVEGEPAGSEDCLTLNVFAPAMAPGAVPTGEARLPVMVWIHGGGNTVGSAHAYNGSTLAAERQVLVVTVQYRMGAFGWFTHPALRDDEGASADDRSGNFGTLDLIRGLAWVEENIGAFGGDPERVTIFGESAGGTNVFSLLLSPRAAGLFSGAIVESGGLGLDTVASGHNFVDDPEPGDPQSASEVAAALIVADGGASDREAAKRALATMPDPELAAYLRGIPAGRLLGQYAGERLGGMYELPKLFRDGHVLPAGEPIEELERAASERPLPVMLGTNRDENKLFLAFGSSHVARIRGLPVRMKDQLAYDLESEYASTSWKATGVDEPARAIARAGGSAYAYRFDWDEQPKLLWLDIATLIGAAHALEIPFVFGRLDLGRANRVMFDADRKPAAETLSQQMTSYWTQFASTGDPGSGRNADLPPWTPWSSAGPDAPKYLLLETEEDGGLRMSADDVTMEGLLGQLATDTRFENDAQRCEQYRNFVIWSGQLSEDEYPQVGGGVCAPYPLADHPWD